MTGGERPESQPRPMRRRRWWPWPLAGLLALVVALGAYWGAQRYSISGQLAAIREAGEPTSFDELDAMYGAQSDDAISGGADDPTDRWFDATTKLAAASERFKKIDRVPLLGGAGGPLVQPGLPWPDLPISQEFLAACDAEMNLLHAAAERGGTSRRFPSLQGGLQPVLDALQLPRTSARALRLEAQVRAHQNDAPGTAQSLLAARALARSMEASPLIVGHLLAVAVHGIATDGVKELLPRVNFSDEDLARLQASLLDDDLRSSMRRGLVGERVYGIEAFTDPGRLAGAPPGAAGVMGIVQTPDLQAYLKLMGRIIAASEQPWPEAYGHIRDAPAPTGRLTAMTRNVAPATQAMIDATARVEAAKRIVGLSVAVERYRRRHGALPAQLADLKGEFVTEVPIDPHTGGALIYRRTAEGYELFSPFNRVPVGKVDPATGAMESLLVRWPPVEPAKSEGTDAVPNEAEEKSP